jgi:hypothetical protein
VKYVANGQSPDQEERVVVTVSKSDDVAKSGNGSVAVKESVLIKIHVADNELQPLGDLGNKDNPNYNKDGPDKRKKIIDFSQVKTTTVTVKVTDKQNNPIPNYSFTIQAVVRSESGGHDHTSNRPTGKFISSTGDVLASLQGTTDEYGNVSYTYLSSGIGGIDSIFVRGKTDRDTANARIVLKTGDFQALAEGDHYDLVGAYGDSGVNSRHKVNHYGTANLIGKLQALADSVHIDSGIVLRINDMSLINGGPFDISNNWDSPHQTHREGISADIDDVDANGKTVTNKYLERWVNKPSLSGRLADEGNHFHVTFR